MNELMANLTRSTGIVATLLAVGAIVWGALFSARATGRRLRPAWWLDLHNWLGGLALGFTGAHVLVAWLDTDSGIGAVQALVPGTASGQRWSIGWGVVATYLLAVAVFTTWPRRLRNRPLWRVLHLASVVGTGLAMLHGYQIGTDASRAWFQVGLTACAAIAVYPLGLRLFGAGRRRGPDPQVEHS